MAKKIKTVAYVRATSSKQVGYTIQAQLEELRAYAEKNNLEIVKEFVDIGPAHSKRKGFDDMLFFLNYSASLQKNIEEWEAERRKLIVEEQETFKCTKTFFEQSNLLLMFCKDCHSAFLQANIEQKKRIIKIVCSNFSYDGENIVIEPNIVFKAVIKNSLNMKKLLRLDDVGTFCSRFV